MGDRGRGDRILRHGWRRSASVVLSASVLPTERATALATGASDFLAKPYRPAELVEAVATLLGSP